MRHPESNLQQCCVKWFRYQFPDLSRMLFAVPNGGKRGKIEASILKAEGVVQGVSDLILLIPNSRYGSLCIEMKYGKGRQTENQKIWEEEAKRFGNKYVVCRSIEEFIKEVKTYLNNK